MGVAAYLYLMVTHPTEFRALINHWVWYEGRDLTDPKTVAVTGWDRESMRECWSLLDQTSRSFSMVIKELDDELARVVCIFYLVLRALDTVEDDMTISNDIKLPLLNAFHEKLDEADWTFNGSGPDEKDRDVLVKFNVIIAEFQRLEPGYQKVIRSVCQKMGRGMASFAALATPSQPVAEIQSISDYDLYCHYVAGLVGEGLSGLFSASTKERAFIKDQLTLSNHMGLLLQKTNILRDFREDVDEGRGFWPRAIWGNYGFDKMGDLRDPAREQEALWALSEMTLDALRHCTPALDYLCLLKCQSVFNFVAIPAVMAIATLERCFMNKDVLKKNVKIRKGEALQLMSLAVNPRDVAYCFLKYARLIHGKLSVHDPNFVKLSIACGKIEQWCEHQYPSYVSIGGSAGKVETKISQSGDDARVRLYLAIQEEQRAKAALVKTQATLDRLRAKGLVKTSADGKELTAKDLEQPPPSDSLPWMLLLGTIFGMLAVFGVLGAIVIYVVTHYLDD